MHTLGWIQFLSTLSLFMHMLSSGIWYNILCGISKFSVITNAFVISFTSEFVPRMVYQYMYSTNGTMTGYTDHSLSYFNVSNFPPGTAPVNAGVSVCRYKDYRDPPWEPDAYTFSKQYWSILAAKLAFVIFFQNLAMFLSMLVAWMIPDVPRSLREQLKRENMMLMEFLLNQDQESRAKTRSPQCSAPCFPTSIDIVVEEPLEHPEWQQPQRNEEDSEDVEANINLDEPRGTPDSDPEIGKSFLEAAENKDELQEVEGEDVHEENEGRQKETDKELNELNEKEDNEEKGGEEKVEEEKRKDEENFTVDLDAMMSEMGILDEDPTSSTNANTPPRSSSKQDYKKDQEPPSHPDPPSKRGSAQSLKGSRTEISSDIDSRLYALIAPPPPREQGSRAKARCSTLPSRHKGADACYSLPRPSHSTSLTRFQQNTALTPLVPLGSSLSASSNPFSPTHAPVSPLSPHPTDPPLANPEPPQSKTPSELFALKGPPPQQPRSRGKVRCSTLPPRQRAPGPEEHSTKPSHSTSFTKLGDRIPPSPSELKRNTAV